MDPTKNAWEISSAIYGHFDYASLYCGLTNRIITCRKTFKNNIQVDNQFKSSLMQPWNGLCAINYLTAIQLWAPFQFNIKERCAF